LAATRLATSTYSSVSTRRLPEPIWEGPTPETAYGPQWSHPHPSFSPTGNKVAYTSDASGFVQMHVARVPTKVAAIA